MITIFVSTILILFSYIISHKNIYPLAFSSVKDEEKSKSQYECGLEPFEEELGKETRERFYIKFYLIGILFLIFDLETLLIFPASLVFYKFPHSLIIQDASIGGIDMRYKAFLVIAIFILILLLGLIYEYRKKIL